MLFNIIKVRLKLSKSQTLFAPMSSGKVRPCACFHFTIKLLQMCTVYTLIASWTHTHTQCTHNIYIHKCTQTHVTANDATVCTSIAKVKAIRSTHDNLRVRFSFRTHTHASVMCCDVGPSTSFSWHRDNIISALINTWNYTCGGIIKHARFVCII